MERTNFLRKFRNKVTHINKQGNFGVILNTKNPIRKDIQHPSRNLEFKVRQKVFLSENKPNGSKSLISNLSLRNNSKFKDFKKFQLDANKKMNKRGEKREVNILEILIKILYQLF